jgi:hypothetical protein
MILTDKKTSSAISGSAKPSVKRLNGLECCHIRPNSLDHASQIHSENRRELDARMRCIACSDLGVEWFTPLALMRTSTWPTVIVGSSA